MPRGDCLRRSRPFGYVIPFPHPLSPAASGWFVYNLKRISWPLKCSRRFGDVRAESVVTKCSTGVEVTDSAQVHTIVRHTDQ